MSAARDDLAARGVRPDAALERALLDARAELVRLRADSDAFRMCVNCGLIVPASHDRAQPGPGCAAPDACTFDLTPREACDHWRAKAHKYQADAQAAVALAYETAAERLDLAEHDAEERDWRSGANAFAALAKGVRAFADADGLAAVEALRGEARESVMQALASMGQAQEAYEAQLKAEAELAAAQQREAGLVEALVNYRSTLCEGFCGEDEWSGEGHHHPDLQRDCGGCLAASVLLKTAALSHNGRGK